MIDGREISREEIASPDHRREHECRVANTPRHWSHVIERPAQRQHTIRRDQSACWLETGDPTARGGNANGAACVGPDRSASELRGHGDRRATARAAGDAGEIPRVVRWPEVLV